MSMALGPVKVILSSGNVVRNSYKGVLCRTLTVEHGWNDIITAVVIKPKVVIIVVSPDHPLGPVAVQESLEQDLFAIQNNGDPRPTLDIVNEFFGIVKLIIAVRLGVKIFQQFTDETRATDVGARIEVAIRARVGGALLVLFANFLDRPAQMFRAKDDGLGVLDIIDFSSVVLLLEIFDESFERLDDVLRTPLQQRVVPVHEHDKPVIVNFLQGFFHQDQLRVVAPPHRPFAEIDESVAQEARGSA
mmetsp:Transcript_32508/g.78689  ORF Transcript_32508/g.78689 Transcript_32508/m.78689 type:complete len:246 (+) Transcript_32508:166-903(+)